MLEFKNEQILIDELKRNNNITRIISIIRLLLAIVLIVFIICLLTLKEYLLYSILSSSFFIVFTSFILITNKYYKKQIHLQNKKQVYNLHYQRRNKKTDTFYDTGQEFLKLDDYKQSDLDIFGKKSLFQYLSIAKTSLGRKKLAKQLSNPDKMPYEYTKCIYNLANEESVIDIEASLLSIKTSAKKLDYKEFLSIVENDITLKPKNFIPLIIYAFELVYFILAIFMQLNPYILISFLIINFLLSKVFIKNNIFKINAISYYNLCDSYLEVSESIINADIKDEYFKNIQNEIKNEMSILKKIKRVYSLLSIRKNTIFNICFNALAIADFWILIIFIKHSKKTERINKLFDNVALVEVMLSFANIGIDNDVYSVPTESNNIKAIDIYHPLVKDCISNSIEFDGGIVLTGSNMSGKTTFMRTLGINQVLFNAGSILCAKNYQAPRMPVYTSLRANDMLVEGVSTFYAEILRMKLMNKAIMEGKCLILVDEIFKGTNANERIVASLKVIDKFNEYNALFIISTHDFELCNANNIANYHFKEEYVDDKISFDYLLRDGKCDTTNALYLLKIANII